MSAALSLTRPPPVPAEYLGRARQFRDSVTADGVVAAPRIVKIVADLQRPVSRRCVPTRDDLALAARSWRLLPPGPRLTLEIHHLRHRLLVTEFRLFSTTLVLDAWQDRGLEPGILIVKLTVNCLPLTLAHNAEILATFSLHALARRFERARPNSAAAVHADLTAAIPALGELTGLDMEIPGTGGRWLGRPVDTFDHEKRAIRIGAFRTFLSDD
jgi:hypothetical protein